MLQKAWEGEEESIWATCEKGWTRFLYSAIVLSATGVWPMRLEGFTGGLHPAFPQKGTNPTAQPCPGFDVDLRFHFMDQGCSLEQWTCGPTLELTFCTYWSRAEKIAISYIYSMLLLSSYEHDQQCTWIVWCGYVCVCWICFYVLITCLC